MLINYYNILTEKTQYAIIQITDTILQKQIYKKEILIMDNILFYNSFFFTTYTYKNPKHTDNSMGIDSHYIGRLCRGTARIVTDLGEELYLQSGDIFYLPQGLRYHSYWYPNADGEEIAELESYRFSYFPCRSGKRYALQKVYPNERASGILESLAADKRVLCSSIGLLYAFLGEVFPGMTAVDTNPQKQLFSKAKHYISKNPDFRVPDLARHCGMSESGLYAFFKSYAQATPIEYKNRIQTEKAIALLASTDLSIEEISDRVGFQSVAYFRKIIKAQTGKTPTEIRKEQTPKYNL